MADEVVIRINGDVKNFTAALRSAQTQTEDLQSGLNQLAKVSAVAFAALTAEIGLSVAAFADSQKASKQLTESLQNQGLYSKELAEDYKNQAAELQKLTGVDDDAIVSSTAYLQSMIGQTVVTKDMTTAILDLSAAKEIDLRSATDLIAKGINGQTGALKKLGIEIDDHLSKEERTAQIVQKVTTMFGGQAAAANTGLGAIKGLKAAFADFQEEIGKRFAPFVEVAIKKLTAFFQYMSENKPLVDLIASLTIAGTVVAGLGTAVGVAGTAFLSLKAALAAAGIATNAMSLAVKGLVGATGIGLLLVVVSEIYLNWNSVWPRMQAAFQAFVTNISALGGGLVNILKGIFTLDMERLKQGLEEAKGAFTSAYTNYESQLKTHLENKASIENQAEEVQNEKRKALADQAEIERQEREALKLERMEEESELVRLQLEGASLQLIELKKQEIELLKQLEDEKYAADRLILEQRLAQTRAWQDQQAKIDEERRKAQFLAYLARNEEYQKMSAEQQAKFRAQNQQALVSQIETEESTKEKAIKRDTEERIQADNRQLEDRRKYGAAYAEINRVMHSEVFQGTKKATGEMTQFQQSSNSTLKGIGKAAAIAQIVIKTAESAMNIYTGFSAIPIIGQALGVAGAAAAIAFGAEQVGKVRGAAKGGLLTGGIPGVDSIPVLAQQNELIAPAQNFEEVIGSVRAKREADRMGGGIGGSQDVSGDIRIVLELRDQLMDFIETKLVERSNIGISLQRVT